MGRPTDYADILNGVMWFQVALATILIALRLYTRHYIVRNIGWDDVLMIVNLVSLRSLCIVDSSVLAMDRNVNTKRIAGRLHRLRWVHICRCHLRRWKGDCRYTSPGTGLFQSHHVGSNRSRCLYHGHCCIEELCCDLSAAYRSETLAHCTTVVLHHKHNCALYYHDDTTFRAMQAQRLPLGSHDRKRLLLAQLHPSWLVHGRYVQNPAMSGAELTLPLAWSAAMDFVLAILRKLGYCAHISRF